MDLSQIVKKYYASACGTQEDISRDKKMIDEFSSDGSDCNPLLIKSWMLDYSLWQGISNSDRDKVVEAIPRIISGCPAAFDQTNRTEFVRKVYRHVFIGLYETVNRNWLSATSKLLWCKYPADFVIFDSFVERSIIVMQWFNDELAEMTRIGAPPKAITGRNHDEYIDFYMRFSQMVYALFMQACSTLVECREATKQSYPYDIRIFDKILWLTANRNSRNE